mmetsp:Transcript_33985/g.85599  ORF Transcript_33985/g.85599 Transcript_33985/m.85599 type:complete len:227 (+) Transcript_33985:658-1338(+)|eukprot:jgi/Tetstr1/420772/TSEL_011849.t1
MARVDVKVVCLGQQNVGKSCLVDRYINSTFDSQQKNTIGAAFAAKRVKLANGKSVTLGIWDTAGAERFESLSRVYYHSARAAVVCFDVSSLESWHKLKFWVDELHQNEPNCRVFIATTKCDLIESATECSARNPSRHMNRPNTGTPAIQRCVSEREVEDYAVTKDARVFLTSAKTGLGVDDLFQCIASDMGDSLSETESDLPSIPPTVRLDGNGDQGNPRPRGRCC